MCMLTSECFSGVVQPLNTTLKKLRPTWRIVRRLTLPSSPPPPPQIAKMSSSSSSSSGNRLLRTAGVVLAVLALLLETAIMSEFPELLHPSSSFPSLAGGPKNLNFRSRPPATDCDAFSLKVRVGLGVPGLIQSLQPVARVPTYARGRSLHMPSVLALDPLVREDMGRHQLVIALSRENKTRQ